MQAPSKLNIKTSILDCRMVYQNMTDYAFATWYSKRYKVLPATILEIIKSEKEKKTEKSMTYLWFDCESEPY